MIKLFSLTIGAFLLLNQSSNSMEPVWNTDLVSSTALAEKESKDLIVAILGPDSDKTCTIINNEILPSAKFIEAVGSRFVLLKAIDPSDADRDKAATESYEDILRTFKVKAYPILFLATPGHEVFGQIRLNKPDADILLAGIKAAQGNKSVLLKAQELYRKKGAPEELASLLERLTPPLAIRYHPKMIDYVIAADPLNERGLREAWIAKRYRATTIVKFNQIYVDLAPTLWSLDGVDEKVKLLDETMAKHRDDVEVLQQLEFQKYRTWMKFKRYDEGLLSIEKSRAFAPTSPFARRLSEIIPKIRKKVVELKAEAALPPSAELDGTAVEDTFEDKTEEYDRVDPTPSPE